MHFADIFQYDVTSKAVETLRNTTIIAYDIITQKFAN